MQAMCSEGSPCLTETDHVSNGSLTTGTEYKFIENFLCELRVDAYN